MPRYAARSQQVGPNDVPVRLHDVGTGLAIAISSMKAAESSAQAPRQMDGMGALALVEDSLAELRKLIADLARVSNARRHSSGLVASLAHEAERLKLRLELNLEGDESWLPPNQAELILLVAREGLRNVSRHAGTAVCRISIDFASCPFELQMRDWGSGMSAAPRTGSGIALLKQMASGMGCRLDLTSQPGPGTTLFLTGPPCAKDRKRQSNAHRTLADGDPTAAGGQIRAN